jgi:hypothetical protein
VDHFFLIERHLRPMLDIVAELGDELANTAPDLPGANTPFQLVFHSCGMLEWWTRESILGEPVGRDRAAEFTAKGTVEELRLRVEQVAWQVQDDLAGMDLEAPLRVVHPDYIDTQIAASPRGALLHALEELAQHHGHLEITRDLLVESAQGTSRTRPNA